MTQPPLENPDDNPALGDSLKALARRGEVRRYRKGTLLIEEGDYGDTLYIVLSGLLRAFSKGPGRREVTYGVYGPGEYLGEISLDGGPRSCSVMVVEPCSCVVLTRRSLLDHIAENPEFAFELLAKVIRRARSTTQSVRELALNDVYGRLVHLLNTLAVRHDGAPALAQRLTHRDFASRLGCSREMVSRLMKDLETGGYIRAEGKEHIAIVKPLPARW